MRTNLHLAQRPGHHPSAFHPKATWGNVTFDRRLGAALRHLLRHLEVSPSPSAAVATTSRRVAFEPACAELKISRRISLLFQGADIDDRPPIHCGLRRVLFRRFWQDPWLFQAGEALQGLRHLLAAADGGRDHVDHGEGRVEVATRLQLLDRHAGRGQGLGVGDAFVAQGIELGRHDERRRQVKSRRSVPLSRDLAAERRTQVTIQFRSKPMVSSSARYSRPCSQRRVTHEECAQSQPASCRHGTKP